MAEDFSHYFYNQTLRRYIAAFGGMFNDIVIQRLDNTGAKIQTIAVPITYSPKEKFLARLNSDPDLDRPIAVQLPALSFEMVSMNYDGTRRLPSTQKNVAFNSSDVNKIKSQFTPVPWNMTFVLYGYVRNADDGAQILEQIIPYFGPEWTNSIRVIPSMGITMDIPTVLNDVTTEDSYEGDYVSRRAIIYTFTFTMKGFFYGPIRTSGIIKRVQVDIGVVSANTSYDPLYGIYQTNINANDIARTGRSSRIVVTPGVLANGSPTTNSAASIHYSLISANSNYGLASNVYFFVDGKKYDPVTGQDNLLVDQTNQSRSDVP